MIRTFAAAAVLLMPVAAIAQGPAPVTLAEMALPDAPMPAVALDPSAGATSESSSSLLSAGATESGWMGAQSSSQTTMAPRYATIILPGQTAVPMHGLSKTVYAIHDSFTLTAVAGFTLSAGWSHLIDSTPHYGHNSEAFGKREGAAALRSTVQTITVDGVFSPMFHDDPRYYEMGPDHNIVKRVVYAASRVVIVRSSHSMNQRINAPLLLGYGVTAAVNNAYYPDQDRGAKNTFQNYATSLAGAALVFEVDEFMDDALKAVHLRKR